MKPLRIAHISNEAYGFETANGVQQVVYRLTRAQAELGHAVAVFSRDDNAVNLLGSVESAFPASRRGRAPGERTVRERLLSRYLEHALLEKVLAWHPDIVHFHSVHIPQNVALAPHLCREGIPYCVTVHGALFPPALRRAWLKKIAFNLLFERHYLNEAQFIQAVNPRETDAIRRRGVNRTVLVVPNGLPPDSSARPARPSEPFMRRPQLRHRRVFMFVGRLDPWQKGLDLLLEAFARARLQDTSLVLVGPDFQGTRHQLETLADRLRISSAVEFMPPAFGEDRANLLAAADVFVHPSRWEGLSLSVLAAAAAGKPCLVTREADPLGELERAQAAIIVEASVASIADGLRRAASLGSNELQAMGRRAQRVASAHFSWPTVAAKLVEAYRGAIPESTKLRDSSIGI